MKINLTSGVQKPSELSFHAKRNRGSHQITGIQGRLQLNEFKDPDNIILPKPLPGIKPKIKQEQPQEAKKPLSDAELRDKIKAKVAADKEEAQRQRVKNMLLLGQTIPSELKKYL